MIPEYSGPGATGAVAAAVQWLDGSLLGTAATMVAVIAMASVGFLCLSGRVDLRRGVQVILGCFILFGAPAIASGILHVIGSGSAGPEAAAALPPPPAGLPAAAKAPPAVPYDPYAGAALPSRR